MGRSTISRPIYGVLSTKIGLPGSGITQPIWGAPRYDTASPPPVVEETTICCDEMTAIDGYVKRITNILTQLNTGRSIPTADQRLDLMTSDITARIASASNK
jgi:hypothetical protein